MPSSFAFLLSLLVAFQFIISVVPKQICAGVGTHDYAKGVLYMGNFFYKATDTFALCADWCRNDPNRCRSFRYSYWNDGSDAQYCEFFNAPAENFFIEDAAQPYWYYDISCNLPRFAVTEKVSVTVGSITETVSRTQTQTMVSTVLITKYSKTRTMTVNKIITSTRLSTVTVRLATTVTKTATIKGRT